MAIDECKVSGGGYLATHFKPGQSSPTGEVDEDEDREGVSDDAVKKLLND